jgi:hypothetical protein
LRNITGMAKIHIGKKIKARLYNSGMSVTGFASQIGRTRNIAYDIFERESMDTGLLLKISEVLNHDFFSYYSKQVKGKE